MENKLTIPSAIIIAAALISITIIYKISPQRQSSETNARVTTKAALVDGGNILPLEIENIMLTELIKNGAIDPAKLPEVTELNLLWAFGLANKNPILGQGPIADMRYGGPSNMASVGGWTVTQGSVMDHFGKHNLVTLTEEQQKLVEKIAKGIYRPCCDNATHFPDCNHGMAMLGLLEYLAANGATEDEIWSAALIANMNWFPDAYQTIAQYMTEKGIDIKNITPREILGSDYSSSSGFNKISSQVRNPNQRQGSNGCGVDSGQSKGIDLPKQKSSCGV